MYSRNPLAPGADLALALLLAACGSKTSADAESASRAEADARTMSDQVTTTEPDEAVIPAIIPPAEVADPTEPPSYEVAIASAAAVHNKALAGCKMQPESVQAQCEQEANAAFTDAKANVQNLRGNKE